MKGNEEDEAGTVSGRCLWAEEVFGYEVKMEMSTLLILNVFCLFGESHFR